MFCPKCGSAHQSVETYCRQCGSFLPDFDKIRKKETPIEEHITVNSFFSMAIAVVSTALAVTLYITLISRETAPWIIYPVFGFLIAITAWQVQTFIRTRILKKQFEKLRPQRNDETSVPELTPKETANLLEEPDFENEAPTSVTEKTTRNLSKLTKN